MNCYRFPKIQLDLKNEYSEIFKRYIELEEERR